MSRFPLSRFPLMGLLLLLALSAGAAPKSKLTPKLPSKPLTKGDTAPFLFIAYGDTRSNPVAHQRIIHEIVGLHPEFVLQSGDLVSNGRSTAQWDEFHRITQPLRDAGIAYYPARGNHDVGPYYPRYVPAAFDSGDKANKLYYAFTRNGSRFIAIDSMQDYGPGSKQYVWLEGELKRSVKYPNTFVLFHESPFSVGPHGPTPEARKYLHPLFVKYHPRAVFCGHDHLYYRTKRDGVDYIVTGGGGAPPYHPENAMLALPGDVYVRDTDSAGKPLSDAEYAERIYHVIRCDVDGSRVTMTVIRLDGSVIDKFTLGPK